MDKEGEVLDGGVGGEETGDDSIKEVVLELEKPHKVGKGRFTTDETKEKTLRFFTLMEDSDFRGMTFKEKAAMVGVSLGTIYRWQKDIHPDMWEKWLKDKPRFFPSRILKVDDALLKQALTGDVAAIKLWYQKEANWSERQISEQVLRNGDLEKVDDADLLKHFDVDVLRKALVEKEAVSDSKVKELEVVDVVVKKDELK